MNVYRSLLFVSGVVCCVLATEPSRAEPQAAPAVRPVPYGFPGDGPPLAMVMRGNLTWLGDFDKDGNFIRHPHCPPGLGSGGGSLLPQAILCISPQHLVYEHRSGRLIKGTEVKKPFGVVVPEIGSTILDIKDVDLKNPDRCIWNMPEFMQDYVAARKRKYGEKPVPDVPDPPKAGTPAGWEFIPFSKSHPGKPPKYARAIGDVVEFGHLSDEGEFVPDPDLPMVTRAGVLEGVKYTGGVKYGDPKLDRIPKYYTVPQPPWLRGPKREGQREDDPEDVYEYRSGRLIRGVLQGTGNFVPDVGSKVLDFKDYDPAPPRKRRIYNLPGVLRKAE